MTGSFRLLLVLVTGVGMALALPAGAGRITTIAGTGSQGPYNGDWMNPLLTNLNWPRGVAVDGQGNVYIADSDNARIRKIDAATGLISTVAGNGTGGCGGDNGPAVDAQLYWPFDLAIDGSGNLYVADPWCGKIRKITASGTTFTTITTVAGTGATTYNGEGIMATAANLNQPYAVAVDTSGNVFVADTFDCLVRRVDAVSGRIRTVVGTVGYGGYNGDGQPATGAYLYLPMGLAFGPKGDLYISDYANNRVRVAVASGTSFSTVQNVAGNGTAGGGGDGGRATDANLNSPRGVAVDGCGNVYIGDAMNCRIRKVNAATGGISTIAGTGTCGYDTDGIPAETAQLYFPWRVALDGARNVFIADRQNSRIRRVAADPSGASLACSWTLSSTRMVLGETVTAVLTVSNTGTADAVRVQPSLSLAPAAGVVTLVGGVAPSGTITIGALACQGFTWTISAVGEGVAGFSATLSGLDAGQGCPLSSWAGAAVTAQALGASLRSSLVVGPPGLIVGNDCTAWLTVTNTGSMAATGVGAGLSSGNPAVLLVTGGGAPAGGVTLLPGASVTFAWSLRAVTQGEAVLQASVTGTDSKTFTLLTLQNQAAVSAVKVAAAANSLLVAPNVLDLSLGDGAVVCYVKGRAGQDVTIRFYNAVGRLMGSRTVGLDAQGEGRLEYTARGLDGVRPASGVGWAVASGGGVSDRKKFMVVPGR